jgi:hypothetical protein
MRTDNSSCDTLDRIQPGFADTDPRTPERRSTRSSNSSTRSEQHRSFVPGEQMPPTLGNEMAEFPADIVHSLVSSKLKRMADQSSLRRDGPLAIVELGSSGKPLARLLAVLNETVRRVKPLELDLIDRAAKRGHPRIDLLSRGGSPPRQPRQQTNAATRIPSRRLIRFKDQAHVRRRSQRRWRGQ